MQPFRGLHYDVARGNYDSLADLRRLIRFSAECGLNEFVLYMEDLWRYQRHPQLANAHAYRLEDMGALAEYAAGQGVDFVPSLTTLGHSIHILEKPAYRHLAFPGEHPDFDVLNPAVYELFAELFDEVLPHFTSPYVFINGDEVRHVDLSEEAREEARKHGIGSLYGRGIGKIAQLVIDRGRRPIMWHDMLLHHPDSLAYLPKETIIAYWYYDYQPDYPADAFFCEQGYDVIAVPGLMANPTLPMYARALPSIHGQARSAQQCIATVEAKGKCLGTMTTIWEKCIWQVSPLAIYATGRWTEDAEIPQAQVEKEFPRDVFGLPDSTAGSAWVEASRQMVAVNLLANAQAGPRSAQEKIALDTEIAKRRGSIKELAEQMSAGEPAQNHDFFERMKQVAHAMITFPESVPARSAAPAPRLYAAEVGIDRDCRITTTKTQYGHDLVILSNGVIAVTLLPQFGAVMTEWVVLGEQPLPFIHVNYDAWAAAAPRVPGDPAMENPWAAARLSGWRETIFYNARLNPSSIWGRPFQVRALRETPEEIALECVGANEVADVRRVVTLRRDQPAIDIDVTATNHFKPGYLAVMPNVGYAFPDTCGPLLTLVNGQEKRPLIDHNGTMMFAPQGDRVRIESPFNAHYLQLGMAPGEVAHILTDISSEGFTLEPFGAVRRCEVGESVHLGLRYEIG
ncbi:MAG: family 20 glycosylhydrolase [Armatimonadota bacterium]